MADEIFCGSSELLDLWGAFFEVENLSPRGLRLRRAFAEAWPDERIVQQHVAQTLWGHAVRFPEHVAELADAGSDDREIEAPAKGS